MKINLLASAAIILGSLGAASSAQADTRLIVNCFWPASHFACSEVLPNWLAEVERVTEGRVTGLIPPRSVAPPPEQLASVESGIADVAVQFNGLIQNRVTGPMVAMQPFSGIRNAEVMSKALWATNREFFPDEFETVQLLSQFVISPGELYSQSDEPINSVEELSSRRMWVLPGPLAAMATELDVGVVSTPAVAANEIISRGVVDGHLGLDPQAVQAFQLMPYTQSTTSFEQPIYSTSFSVFMNNDTWSELSEADQAAIMEVSGAVLGAAFGARWDHAAATAVEAYGEAGIDVVDADPAFEAALVELGAPITAGWLGAAQAAGIDGAAALDFYKAQIATMVP